MVDAFAPVHSVPLVTSSLFHLLTCPTLIRSVFFTASVNKLQKMAELMYFRLNFLIGNGSIMRPCPAAATRRSHLK